MAERALYLAWLADRRPSPPRCAGPGDTLDDLFPGSGTVSRTGSGPANLATICAAIIAAIKNAGYLHIPEGRRDHTTPAETLHLHGLD